MAKTRSLTFVPSAEREYQTSIPNLLVAGCSYVWNNSEEHACTWPYYIQDIVGFSQVFDCSQSGGGPDNVFNSIINELTINPLIDKDNTLIVVMWPELARTDVIATATKMVETHHRMSLYRFADGFSNLSIFNRPVGTSAIDDMSKAYKKIVSTDAQEYQSLIKILALSSFLENLGYHYLFLSWKQIDPTVLENHGIPKKLIDDAIGKISSLISLDDYTEKTNQRIPGDGHPTPDAHISWAREYLAPFLSNFFPEIITIKGVGSFPRGT